jgi:hypothetical protein
VNRADYEAGGPQPTTREDDNALYTKWEREARQKAQAGRRKRKAKRTERLADRSPS